jgi:hypothetical protein
MNAGSGLKLDRRRVLIGAGATLLTAACGTGGGRGSPPRSTPHTTSTPTTSPIAATSTTSTTSLSSPTSTSPPDRMGALEWKGVNYDVGTAYVAGFDSRQTWRHDFVDRELTTIRDELGCNARLAEFLNDAVTAARSTFGGRVTYSAGTWEVVDWSPFDAVGSNLYRDAHNVATYRDDLRRLFDHNRPVLITEFGCAAHRGAAAKGPNGDDIVDWSTDTPTLTGAPIRDEQVQAEYIDELLDLPQARAARSCSSSSNPPLPTTATPVAISTWRGCHSSVSPGPIPRPATSGPGDGSPSGRSRRWRAAEHRSCTTTS